MDKAKASAKIIEEARAFAEEKIAPFASEFDRKETLPQGLIEQLAKKKFLTPNYPRKYGGLDLDPVSYGLFTEEIGKACSSTRALITTHASLVGETLLRWGTEAQKKKWLPAMARGEKIGAFALSEPEVGSDARGVRTSYRKSREGFIISGIKKWISFGELAGFFIVAASDATSDSQRVSAFIIEGERKGIITRHIPNLLGHRASNVTEIEFKDVSIPEENILAKEGSGFPYVIGTGLDHGKYSVAWGGVAIAQASLEAMVGYARKRRQFGKKIHEFQLVRGMIGDAVTNTHVARAMCLRAGEMRRQGNPDAIHETAIAKYFASRVALEIASDAVQVHGGSGCSQEYPVERYFRDAKTMEIIEGTNQIHQELLANFALRKFYKK